MRHLRGGVSVVSSLLLAVAARAADVDLRIGYDHPDQRYRVRMSKDKGSGFVDHTTVEGTWNENDRLSVGVVVTHGYFAFGGSASYQSSLDRSRAVTALIGDDDVDVRARRYGPRIEGGASIPVSPWLRIEALPFIGAGLTDLHVVGGATDFGGNGWYSEFGGDLNLVAQPTRRFKIGLGAGFVYARTRIRPSDSYIDPVSGDDASLHEHGIVYRMFVGIRL